MDKIITIVSSEIKPTKSGDKEYASIKDQDGDIYSVWDRELWTILDTGMTAKIDFVKQGNFRNIIKAEPVKAILEKVAVEKVKKINEDNRTKTMTLSYSKDLAVAGKIDVMKIISWATIFEKYVNGEISVADEVVMDFVNKYLRTQKAEAKKEAPIKEDEP